MLPILSSATQPVKPDLKRDADNLARFSPPPGHRHNHDEENVDENYADKNDEDWSAPR